MKKRTIYSFFRDVAERQPDSVAIITDERRVTFAELSALIDNIAQNLGNREGQFVGIVMSHGIEQIATMLAVLKSGAAYVPAEPALAPDRIKYMMDNAGVSLIINDRSFENIQSRVQQEKTTKLSSTNNRDYSSPDGIAYVLYTSGTTGRPKGVMVENHSVVNYAEAFGREMEVGTGDVMLQYSICSFDIFVEEVFASLLNGVAIAIPSPEVHDGSLEKLMDFCRRNSVTILDGFPYLIADINRQPELLPECTRLIISGGDVVRNSYITNLRDRNIRIYNTYGPSETTVCCTYFRIDNATALDDGTFPIGKAIKGVEVQILDEDMNPVKKGKTGQICISGEGVSRGYMGNAPEQANFVVSENGRRVYKSGDLGYEMEDGNIAFLHRCDDQVMILGRRVEPEEVENILNEYDGIERGVVRADKDAGGLHFLTAYIVTKPDFKLSELKKFMLSKLADFMIPEFFIKMDKIPITPRGKVNTSALPRILKERTYA